MIKYTSNMCGAVLFCLVHDVTAAHVGPILKHAHITG